MDHEKEEKKNECIVCQRKFTRSSALYRHVREVHKVEVQFSGRVHKFKCPDPTCSVTCPLSERLRNHIEDAHGIKIELCVKRFKTFEEFERWKDAVEYKLKSLYVTSQTKKSVNKNQHHYYMCHRSGFFNSKSIGMRKSSSKKINGWCPSGMDVTIFWKEGIQVKFWMTHFGHECEVDRLNLSRQEKRKVAEKLKQGVSFDKILDDVRDSLVDDDIRRIHLLSRKDIHNISKAFKISNKESLIQQEASDVNLWVESMKALGDDCPVIFYKEKGSEYTTLKTNDFLLVILTNVQQKMLERCSNHIVCFDDIKTSHLYNYHLVTLITIDDFEVGCPLAFCVSNKVDDSIVSLFIKSIHSKVGKISCNVFMSPDIPVFYAAWQKVMGPANVQLLCSWMVDKNWRKELEKLSCSEERKIRTYKCLRQIMHEQEFDEYHSLLEDILEELDEDSDMKVFSGYFRARYLERPELWAFYYRSHKLLQYSLTLERIHRGLNECYAEGRSINSFVRTLNLIMGFSRDRMLEKLEKLPKEFQIDKLGNVCQIHQEIQQIDVVKTQEISEKQLQVPTVERDCCYVEHNIGKICPPDCKPICNACSICFHRFTCTCIENFINLNICRHIHASVNLMKSQCSHMGIENSKEKDIENSEIVFANNELSVSSEEAVELVKDKQIMFTSNEISVLGEEEVVELIEEKEVVNVDEEVSETILMVDGVICDNDELDCDVEESDVEALRSSLKKRMNSIHDVLESTTFKPEQYKVINRYFDEIMEVCSKDTGD